MSATISVIEVATGAVPHGRRTLTPLSEVAAASRQRDALYQLSEQLQRASSLQETYDAAMDAIESALACDRSAILLFDAAGVMQFVASRGLGNVQVSICSSDDDVLRRLDPGAPSGTVRFGVIERLRRPVLTTDYGRDLRLFPSRASKVALVVLFLVWIMLPNQASDFWLNVLNRAGVFAIGALGLNLLTGYTGQVSLGHAFFMAVGGYTWAHFGADMGWPLLVWLPLAGIIGAAVGAAIGPFALRLRGNYLAIVSLGLAG